MMTSEVVDAEVSSLPHHDDGLRILDAEESHEALRRLIPFKPLFFRICELFGLGLLRGRGGGSCRPKSGDTSSDTTTAASFVVASSQGRGGSRSPTRSRDHPRAELTGGRDGRARDGLDERDGPAGWPGRTDGVTDRASRSRVKLV